MRLLLLSLCACGRVAFDPTTGGVDPDGGNTGDGMVMTGDSGGGGCTTTTTCTFPGGFPPCTCWGSPTVMNAGVDEDMFMMAQSGQLLMTDGTNMSSVPYNADADAVLADPRRGTGNRVSGLGRWSVLAQCVRRRA